MAAGCSACTQLRALAAAKDALVRVLQAQLEVGR